MKAVSKFQLLLAREAEKRAAHNAALAPKPAKAKAVTKKVRSKK